VSGVIIEEATAKLEAAAARVDAFIKADHVPNIV
jgi:hypothetical protein